MLPHSLLVMVAKGIGATEQVRYISIILPCTVVSNIHRGGISSVEAGAYIAELIKKIYDAKASGVELKQ